MNSMRPYRRWLPAWLVAALLFTQIATAAYACPQSVPMDAAAVGAVTEMPDCHRSADAFRGNEALSVVGIQQKRRKFLAAKTSGNISGTQGFLYDTRGFFQRSAANKVTVTVVNFLKVVEIHHQDAEGPRISLRARRLASQLGEERLTG